IARAIHHHSSRSGRRFVAINCASLPENLLESELFGHERGAFTGAVTERKGRFQYADGGTLFLDEIGDMPLPLQAKLLRAIEHGEVTPVGSNEPLRVNVRVLSATHRDLEKLIAEGRFREDLYFRINVVRIELPALRERMDDLPLLVSSFLEELSKAHGRKVRGLSHDALTMLYRYRWPGNVRELRNTIESMVVMSRGEALEVGDVPRTISGRVESSEGQPGLLPVEALNLEEAERELIQRALLLYQGNRKNAAKALGIGERTLYRKMNEYGLE
ncbi:MAG TPA: sigma-54 dependent transcriptional regulator, partial [Planctomycetota bacterium]|nr:sigma-54 dependent transcriptional regulator [Planctomycetota bacterium]